MKLLESIGQKGGALKDEWNSGCDWPKLWQVCGKLVGSELNELNAAEVWGKLPGVATWVFNTLMGHRSAIVGYKLSKVEAARLDRRAGTKGALTILYRCKKCGFVPKYYFM